jgi:hypothetical protein
MSAFAKDRNVGQLTINPHCTRQARLRTQPGTQGSF